MNAKKVSPQMYRAAIEVATQVCLRAAEGDLEARVVNTEEFGELAVFLTAINKLLDQTDAYVRESAASLESASKRKYFRRFLLRGMLGDFRRGATVINSARESMERRHKLTEKFQSVVSGVVGTVSDASTKLEETAEGLAASAESTYGLSVSVSAAAEQSAVNARTVAASTEELSSSISDISRQAEKSMASAAEAAEEMEHANAAAVELDDAAQRIEQVTLFVKKIADQTNLLALNAAIEAARAGEAGRGFAIVASEVKALANQVGDATADIETQIESIHRASQGTATAIGEIDTRIQNVREVTTIIASAVTQQTAVTSEISSNIHQAADGAQDISTNVASIKTASEEAGGVVQEMHESAHALAREANMLRGNVEEFLQKLAAT